MLSIVPTCYSQTRSFEQDGDNFLYIYRLFFSVVKLDHDYMKFNVWSTKAFISIYILRSSKKETVFNQSLYNYSV